MIFTVIPEPGTLLGPCDDDNCSHLNCKIMRERANKICNVCGKPCGYGNKITKDHKGNFIHWDCRKIVFPKAGI